MASPPKSAPCGYVFKRSLAGMDYSAAWGNDTAYPVTCPECRLKGPPTRTLRKRKWEDVNGGKTRF
jgi:hypothetical protein